MKYFFFYWIVPQQQRSLVELFPRGSWLTFGVFNHVSNGCAPRKRYVHVRAVISMKCLSAKWDSRSELGKPENQKSCFSIFSSVVLNEWVSLLSGIQLSVTGKN